MIKLCKCCYSYQDDLQNDFFCRKPRCLLFLEECWINCFIRYAIKRSMIITFNQEFIAFNEPILLFLFNWCLIFLLNFPFKQNIYQNIILKMKMQKTSLKDLKILIFLTFYFLVLTFHWVNIIECWKLIQIVEAVTFAIALRRLLLFLDMLWYDS